MVVVDQTTKPILGSDGLLGQLGIPLDVGQILNTATNLTGSNSGNSDLFQNALQRVNSEGALGSINDQTVLNAHQHVYKGSGSGVNSNDIGAAAALETLKSMVTGGAQGRFPPPPSQLMVGAGNSNDAFVGMAMSEAAKRYDALHMQGSVSSGDRQEAVSNAAKTALQLISQAGGTSGGKSGGGGEGGIIGNLLGGQGGGPVQGLLGNIL
jgi:hypothetical protein